MRKKQKFFMALFEDVINEAHLNPADFCHLDTFLGIVGSEFRRGSITKEELTAINSAFSKEFLQETLQGRGLIKPCGYPGDYLLLDKIYTEHFSTKPKYRVWDRYFQRQAITKALRNRKEYFKDLLFAKTKQHYNLNVLNIVSGSGREMLELYNELPVNNNLKITCVEQDDAAIDYSKNLNRNYLNKITYSHENAFRYRNKTPRDVIWSAGLFNYMEDRAFLLLLKRFKKWLKPGGEIIIGNCNAANNSGRDYMEIFLDWFLIYRTAEQLRELGRKAGFKDLQIDVKSTGENVILYLHLSLPQMK